MSNKIITYLNASQKVSQRAGRIVSLLLLLLMLVLGDVNVWGQTKVSDGIYYIRNNNTNSYGYLWPSVTTNSTTGYRYLTTSLATTAASVTNNNGVSYPAHDKSYSHWVVKNVTGGYIQLINPRLDKYVVIRAFPKVNNTKENEYGDRDVWLTDKPAAEDIEYSYFELINNSSPFKISPKQGLNGVNTTGYSFNSASGNSDRVWLTWSKTDNKPQKNEGREGLIQLYSGGTPVWAFTSDLLDAPTISDVDANDMVTVTDANGLPDGYNIRYTTDNSNPTATSSIMEDGEFTVTSSLTLKTVVERYGIVLSEVATKELAPAGCATPVITYDYNTSNVSITCATLGSTIYYTIDGSTPSASNTEYSEPFSVISPTTVKAIATHATKPSSVVAELAISKVATPTIQNNGSNAISITTETPGATIYYTTDGSTPNTSSTVYSSPLTDNVSNVTIKAIAVKENMITSSVGSGLVKLQCATPVITRTGLTFSLSCSMPTDATLYYTLGGGSETLYNGPVSFTKDQLPMTVTTVARHSDYIESEEASMELKNGEGTPDDPYLIAEDTDFSNFITNVNNGTAASKCFKLITDISASGATAITSSYSGVFDGNGYTISGLSYPLFSIVDGGVVKNVTLKNVHINQNGNVGAIAGEAKGYTRIYNCGILPNDNTFSNRVRNSSVTSTDGYCGGLVGWLKDDSRVINCYSYANVSGRTDVAGIVGHNEVGSTAAVTTIEGKDYYSDLRTAVVNCMFYGNITGGTNRYPVYGGSLITNAAETGISSYNYYSSNSTFNTANGRPTAYNCSFPAEERYLTQVEFHRSLLNSNRELCGWWVGSDVAPNTLTTAQVQAIPKDASLMYKWVVDPSVAPYPILKPFGKYASVINGNTGTPWVNRATANPYEGKKLGTLTVKVKSGSHSSAGDKTLYIPITDMDTLHYDFGYRKIQLPYYNTVFGNPSSNNWNTRYADNYTEQVVTGWKVTKVETDGTVETYNEFVPNWETGYNFADRKCTDKDLYGVSGRVFAQGGNYYVPDGVTEITIEAYWGKAIYVGNDGGYYDRVNITLANTGSAFAPAGTRSNNFNGANIATSIRGALTATNIDAKKTVYDYALVLVGNVQESVGKSDVKFSATDYRGFTIMSVDLDFDEEPDYCLEWQLGENMARQVIAPIRFDFIPVVELGIAGKLHNSTNFYSLGCYRSQGHFEVTETSFIRFGQFEFELGDRDDGPIILNGGIYDQYCRGRNGETNQHINYVILGGHVVMPSFTPGAHVNEAALYQTRHCAVNALGGDFTSFYLTGGYNEAIVPYNDNPHCYIDGGRFGTIAAAYKEGIAGDVTWRINHALIGEFYGGGVMAQKDGTTYKTVKGSIDVVINNSIVGKYCGGPKFGDMEDGKTVTTSATGTTFNQYFGAGNGGTNYVQYKNTDSTGSPINSSNWASTINSNYHPGQYRNTAQGYEADYDIEVINPSTGDKAGNVVNRSYYYSAQFATTNTGNVTSELTDCTINTNFYGGGFLGGVTGNVTSTLNNCTVKGAVFGAGYSASAGTVSISNIDKTPPVVNTYTGMIKPQTGGTSTTYYWTHDKGSTSSPITAATEADPKNYFYTEIPLDNLGTVSGNVTLTINGTTTVGESVYGGGESSNTIGNSNVSVFSGSISHDVYGGGALANVGGNTKVFLLGGTVNGDVYGGGKGRLEAGKAGEDGYVSPIAATVGSTKVNLNGLETGDYVAADHSALVEVYPEEATGENIQYYTLKSKDSNNKAIKGCVVKGSIFGCNNLNGTPKGSVTVNVYKTEGYDGHQRTGYNAETATAREAALDDIDDTHHSYEVKAVYGGGNLAAYEPDDANNKKTQVNIYGCGDTSIQQVYGGGNAASTPATLVHVYGTYEIEEVFGGGNGKDDISHDGGKTYIKNPGANVGFKDYWDYENEKDKEEYDTKEKRAAASEIIYGTGAANVNIHGGRIHRVYGGSNTKGNVKTVAVTMLEDQEVCDFKVDEAYGGGKSAEMDGASRLEMACIPGLKNAYGGAEAADIASDVTLNITNGNFNRVFGGNNVSGTIHGRITVNIEETGCHLITIGQLYGGGNQAAYTGPEILDDENKGTGVFQGPTVNVKSFTSIGEVYGGGYGKTAIVKGDTYVNINVCDGKSFDTSEKQTAEVENANTHTGDQLISFSEFKRTDDGGFVTDDDGNRIVEEKNIHVYLPPYESGIGNIGNVYGGGNAAKVDGSTHVNIGTVDGDITFETPTADAEADRKHTVKGANIVGNVYGGGNAAEVTGNTNVTIGKEM